MTLLNNIDPGYNYSLVDSVPYHPENFNQKVLLYIKNNKPHDGLSHMLEQMKGLSPEDGVTMQQLNEALFYADATLRNDDQYKNYTTEFLDKYTGLLIMENIMVSNMLLKGLVSSEEED